MQYALITSVDAESNYKAMIRSNRRHFKFQNFKLLVMSNCFPHEDYLDDSK